MNTILGFKNLEEEDLEDNPCPENLREKMVEFHDSLMQVMSISSLEEEDVEIEPKSDEKPSILSVIFKVINGALPSVNLKRFNRLACFLNKKK